MIADECPPGEIAATIGVPTAWITRHYPEAKGTKAQLKEWQSLTAMVTETERKYFNKRTGLPELQRGRDYELEQQRRAKAERDRQARLNRMKPRHEWSAADLATAERMLREGASYNRVAERIGVARRTIQKRFPGYGHPAKRKAEAA
ncbi:hypothetical protein [Gordonia sp. YC-JH1]|nr:hypothetical protein [Gordonia sp. YC-JH1]